MSLLRHKLIQKLAQTVPSGTANTTQTNTSVSGSPPNFTASTLYPSLIIGYTTHNITLIDTLANILNNALYYASNGKINLQWMRQNNFNFMTDQTPSVDLKNIMEFCKLVYNNIFTNFGAEYKSQLDQQIILQRMRILLSSSALNNLSSLNPASQLANVIGGNLKTVIQDVLQQIK